MKINLETQISVEFSDRDLANKYFTNEEYTNFFYTYPSVESLLADFAAQFLFEHTRGRWSEKHSNTVIDIESFPLFIYDRKNSNRHYSYYNSLPSEEIGVITLVFEDLISNYESD